MTMNSSTYGDRAVSEIEAFKQSDRQRGEAAVPRGTLRHLRLLTDHPLPWLSSRALPTSSVRIHPFDLKEVRGCIQEQKIALPGCKGSLHASGSGHQ